MFTRYMGFDQDQAVRWFGDHAAGLVALIVSVAAVVFAASQARSAKKQAVSAAAAHDEAKNANAIAMAAHAEAQRANAVAERFQQQRAWEEGMPKLEFLHWQIEGPFIVGTFTELQEMSHGQVFDPTKDCTGFIGYRVTGTIVNHGEQMVYLWPDGIDFVGDDEVGQRLRSTEAWRRHLLAGERAQFEWTPHQTMEVWMRRYAYPNGDAYPPDALSPVEGWQDHMSVMSSLSPERRPGLTLVLNLDAEPVVPRHPRLSGAWAARDDLRQTSVNAYQWIRGGRRPHLWQTTEHYPPAPDS